jgi:hypothetical protein
MSAVMPPPRKSKLTRKPRNSENPSPRCGSALPKYIIALVVPRGYAPGKAIPVVVRLHGMGSVPSDFAGKELQRIADQHCDRGVNVRRNKP